MIDGHGDDAYKYGQKIRINFSSNVYNHVNHNGLREHLYHRMESIRSYPEPEPYSLFSEKNAWSILCYLHSPTTISLLRSSEPATRLYLFYPLSIADNKKESPRQAIHREEILRYIQKLRTELFIL